MSVSPVTSAVPYATSSGASSSAVSTAATNAGLTQSDFLKLLTTEMKNQDPLNPTSNDQFLGELAQFTALQQTTDMSMTMNTLTSTMQQTGTVGFLGKQVTITQSDGSTVTGTVTQVGTDANKNPIVTVNGTQYAASLITSVTNPPATTTTTTGN